MTGETHAPWQDLAGERFLFDYGEVAKFQLYFSEPDTVEVTALAGVLYSISTVDTFPVATVKRGERVYEIAWCDPAQKARFTHTADFGRGETVVVIEDDELAETRRFTGTISSA